MKAMKNNLKMKTRREITEAEKVGSRRVLANGSYTLAMTAVVIAVIVVVNLIIGAIPSRYTVFDVSATQLFSIGDTTKEILDNLDEEVTIAYLTQSGNGDERIEKLLETYEGYSGKIKVETVDVVANPTYTRQYTEDDVTVNSLLVSCGDKFRLIDYNDLYEYSYSNYAYTVSGFDGEGQITSAISYVTADSTAKIYYTTGHNEVAFDENMTNLLDKANVDYESINLLSTDIPADCTALIIFSPMTDFTSEEASKVKSYLDYGGHAMIVSFYGTLTADMENFDSIMSVYGIDRVDGLVEDADTSMYMSYPYLLLPNVTATSVTSGLGSLNLLYGAAGTFAVDDEDDETAVVTPFLYTSESGYLKDTDSMSTLEQEDGDETGSFPLAVLVEKTLSVDSSGQADVTLEGAQAEEEEDRTSTATKVVYYTTPGVFSMSALSTVIQQQISELPSGNATLFSNTISYLTDAETPISIDAKSLSLEYNTVTASQATVIGTILMIGLPAAVLIAGIVIFVLRRRH